jgi:preprotein translocase subunit SecD
MIKVARWKIVLIGLVCLWGIIFSLPNLLTEEQIAKLPNFLHKTVNLGLELRGGSHLQLEVDLKTAQKDMLANVIDDVRSTLRKKQIGYTNLKATSIGDKLEPAVTLNLRDTGTEAEALDLLKKVDHDLVVKALGDGQLQITYDPVAFEKRKKAIVSQSIEVIRRRIDESGTKEPTIQAQGEDRIIVQVPGISDPSELKRAIGKTAKLTFHCVDENIQIDQATGKPIGNLPPDVVILPEHVKRGEKEYTTYVAIKKPVMLSGDSLVDSQYAQDDHQRPAVGIKLNSSGAKKFSEMSKEFLKKRFAIVLDNVVLSAPVFSVILPPDGNSIITGVFTVKEVNDLCLLLRAGALPAPLKIIEERTVGPSLGADSIRDGFNASILSFILVSLFMLVNYSLFGVFADIALAFNMILLFAALSLLQATLTLPGIAAIALSMGMAVDANVLIYERIKEELRHGLKPAQAIEAGYQRAMTTIVDSQLTTLVGSAVLFQFGTGPIRGFAVNLALGIVISLFTAIALTKVIVAKWIGKKPPQSLPI